METSSVYPTTRSTGGDELKVGPVRVQVRWDANTPERADGELYGDPEHARELNFPHGRTNLVGRLRGGSIATVKDVLFTSIKTSQSHEYGPRLLAEFVADEVEVRATGDATGAEVRRPTATFLLPDDPVWLGFTGHFGFEPNDPVAEPVRKFDHHGRGLNLSTGHRVYSGGVELAGGPGPCSADCPCCPSEAGRRRDLRHPRWVRGVGRGHG